MRARRVVTGQAGNGRATVVSDERIEPVTVALFPGAGFHRIWGADGLLRVPTDGSAPVAPGHFPPPGGFRFSLFTMAPDERATSDLDPEDAEREIRNKLPGLLDVLEPGTGGRHATDTVDLNFIVSGQVWLLLDDAEVLLESGDCVVQNGTRHGWSNRSTEPCVMVVAQIGASRARPA